MVKKVFFFFISLFSISLFSETNFYISDSGWDFGEVLEGSVLRHNLFIENNLDGPLKIFLRAGCPCIKLDKNEILLQKNEKEKIKIIFDTKGEIGEVYKNIYINTDKGEFIEYPVEGKVYREIKIFLFYESGCNKCKKIEEKIKNIKRNFNINLITYRIDLKENFEKFLEFEKKSGEKVSGFPVVFVNNKVFSGKEIENFLNELQKGIIPEKIEEEKKISWAFFPFLSAALLDGINPCAFSVIIIMLTYLSVFGRKRSFVFASGILYTLGVFITYFLFGLGIIKFLKKFSEIEILSKILFLFFALVSLFLAVFSFKDFLNLLREKTGRIFLKVPSKIQFKVVNFVEKLTEKKYFVFIAFFTGIVVSIIEFICTGQVYLPSLSYIIGVEGLKLKPIFYLFIYNIFFIIPMLIVFFLFYFGIKISDFEKLVRGKRMILIKFFHFLIFLFFTIFFIIKGVV